MKARFIYFVSGDWMLAEGQIKIRLETNDPRGPQDFLIALSDLPAFVTLLLILGRHAAGTLTTPNLCEASSAILVPVDGISVGEASDGQALLQLDVGQTPLAFAFPKDAVGQLGRTLLALNATARTGSA